MSAEYPPDIRKHKPLAVYYEICSVRRPAFEMEELLNKIRIEHIWHYLQSACVTYIHRNLTDTKMSIVEQGMARDKPSIDTLNKTWVF